MEARIDPRLGQLLEHTRWMRGLARGLTHDDASADDLVQDAWVAALRSPPREGEPRGWLGAVLRNTRRMALRGDRRRLTREQAVVDPDARVESAAELAGEVELGRVVTEALLALDEPYRETLLLTFYRELSSSEIGARRGVPAATVRSHVRVGLERLRAALDERYGDRATWKRALVPMAGLPRVIAKGVVMGKLATSAASVVAVAGAIGVIAVHRAKSASTPIAALSAPLPPSPRSALRARIDQLRPQRPAHDALVARIEARQPSRPTTRLLDTPRPPSPPGSIPPEAWKVGDLDPEYIRLAIQDTLPLFKQCLEDALVDHPDLSGKITLKFTIEGDPDVGGVVGESEVDRENSTILLPELHECFEQTIYAARFPAPSDHGVVVVSYPFKLLAVAPDGGDPQP